MALICPSSAAIERAFSFLRAALDDSQESTLEDAVETTCMLRYNDRSGRNGEVDMKCFGDDYNPVLSE